MSAAVGSSPTAQAWAVRKSVRGVSASALTQLWQSLVEACELAHAREPQRGAQSGAINIASRITKAVACRRNFAMRCLIISMSNATPETFSESTRTNRFLAASLSQISLILGHYDFAGKRATNGRIPLPFCITATGGVIGQTLAMEGMFSASQTLNGPHSLSFDCSPNLGQAGYGALQLRIAVHQVHDRARDVIIDFRRRTEVHRIARNKLRAAIRKLELGIRCR